MSRDGSGNYSLPEAPFVFDTVISETAVNSNFSDIAAALTQSRSKDGQTTPTANQNYGGYKHTNINTSAGSSSRSEYVAAAVAQDGAIWDAGSTSGTSTAYTATLSPSITAYADKQCFRVKFDQACGVDPTINFNSVGAKKIYKNVSGTPVQLEANDVLADQIWQLRYDSSLDGGSGGFWLLATFSISALTETTTVDNFADFVPMYDASATANRKVRPEYLLGLMRGHVYGLTLSNNTTDANNDIDIAAGQAVDNTNFALMVLASSLTKRLDANWAVGTNQGGLDTGAKANSTWYYVWLIQRSDTGVVDALFSTSATSPTMPTDYDRKRRIGAIRTDGSGNIMAFRQNGNEFRYVTTVIDANQTTVGTARTLVTLTAPPSFSARYRAYTYRVGGPVALILQPTFETDGAPSNTAPPGYSLYSEAASQGAAAEFQTQVDSNSQIAARCGVADSRLTIVTFGWIDLRDQ